MMPDFRENADIIIQPADEQVPYNFNLPASSSATANDGAIPYDTNIDSVAVTAHMDDDTADSELVDSSSVSSNTVTVKLTYPSTNGVGIYHLEMHCTLDNGDASVIEFDFNRVKVRDK